MSRPHCPSRPPFVPLSAVVVGLLALPSVLIAQPDQTPPTIDLGQFVPEVLAKNVTVEFDEVPLKDVAAWIQSEHEIPVVVDASALADVGIPTGEPISDQLKEAPLYLLLERLGQLGLSWYVEDDVLYISTDEVASERLSTQPYEMADLLDAGGSRDGLVDAIQSCTDAEWEDIDGIGGTASWLGDVLFIQQNDRVHWEVGAVLIALRSPGPRTLLLEPATHMRLRELLDQPVSVDFDDTPLYHAIRLLAEQTGGDIRLDNIALTDVGIRMKEPVTLKLTDRKLRTVLKAILANHGLTWILEDGVMWVTTQEIAEEKMISVVFTIGDLAEGEDEEQALLEALQTQTDAEWEDIDGIGGTLTIPVPGKLIVRQTGRAIEEITRLLALYRSSLANSKLRPEDRIDPNEVVTRYYRMDTATAMGLANLIPQLVQPESWQGADPADENAPRILQTPSGYDLVRASGQVAVADANQRERDQSVLSVPQSALIIRQSRAAHDEIRELIRNIRHGETGGFFGGGFGGGGFGGGLGGGGLGAGGGGGLGGGAPDAPPAAGGFGGGLIGTGSK